MFVIDETTPKIAISDGYFVCLPTGATDDYPGLGIFFSKDGKTVDWNDLISITEYNSVFKNIQTVGFQQGQENYVLLFVLKTETLLKNEVEQNERGKH